jgi:hypothetical protein
MNDCQCWQSCWWTSDQFLLHNVTVHVTDALASETRKWIPFSQWFVPWFARLTIASVMQNQPCKIHNRSGVNSVSFPLFLGSLLNAHDNLSLHSIVFVRFMKATVPVRSDGRPGWWLSLFRQFRVLCKFPYDWLFVYDLSKVVCARRSYAS